jgi:hypothetical protein
MDVAEEALSLGFGLAKIDHAFLTVLAEIDAALCDRLLMARSAPSALNRKAEAELIVALAPHLEDFIGILFDITDSIRALQAQHNELAPLYSVKRLFVQRRATKGKSAESLTELDGDRLAQDLTLLFGEPFCELTFARHVTNWMDNELRYSKELELSAKYAAWAALTKEGQRKHDDGILFKIPHKIEHTNLIPLQHISTDGIALLAAPDNHRREREGFGLTDAGIDLTGALDQAIVEEFVQTRARPARRARRRERRRPSGANLGIARELGRCDGDLSAPPDRCAELYSQP